MYRRLCRLFRSPQSEYVRACVLLRRLQIAHEPEELVQAREDRGRLLLAEGHSADDVPVWLVRDLVEQRTGEAHRQCRKLTRPSVWSSKW